MSINVLDATAGTVALASTTLTGEELPHHIMYGVDGSTPRAIKVNASSEIVVAGTFWQATQPVSIASPVAVTGTFWQATQPVSLASPVAVTGTFWQATQPVSGTFWQATQPVSLASLPALAAGTADVGDFGAASRATGTGGLTAYALNASAATNNATSVKASAGRVYAVIATNNGAANRYLKLYNKASAPSPASDTPVATYMLPAGGGICRITDIGLVFSTGIAFAVVAGISATDNTSISASEVAVNIEYA